MRFKFKEVQNTDSIDTRLFADAGLLDYAKSSDVGFAFLLCIRNLQVSFYFLRLWYAPSVFLLAAGLKFAQDIRDFQAGAAGGGATLACENKDVIEQRVDKLFDERRVVDWKEGSFRLDKYRPFGHWLLRSCALRSVVKSLSEK